MSTVTETTHRRASTRDDDYEERERGREDDERNRTHRLRDASEDENDVRRRCDVGFDAHLDSGTHGQRKRGADDDADDAERDVGRGQGRRSGRDTRGGARDGGGGAKIQHAGEDFVKMVDDAVHRARDETTKALDVDGDGDVDSADAKAAVEKRASKCSVM